MFKNCADKVFGLCEGLQSLRENANRDYLDTVNQELQERILKNERMDQEKNLLERFRRINIKRGDFQIAINQLKGIKCKKWASVKDIVEEKIYDSAPVIKRFNELREASLELIHCIREHYYLMNYLQDRVDENQYLDGYLRVEEIYSVPVLLEINGADTCALQECD